MNGPIRADRPPERLDEMHAHVGICRHCGGIVKMERNAQDGTLQPDRCCCFFCGQRYYMQIPDLVAWEQEQWEQKGAMWNL